jgi:hypothetical protein
MWVCKTTLISPRTPLTSTSTTQIYSARCQGTLIYCPNNSNKYCNASNLIRPQMPFSMRRPSVRRRLLWDWKQGISKSKIISIWAILLIRIRCIIFGSKLCNQSMPHIKNHDYIHHTEHSKPFQIIYC